MSELWRDSGVTALVRGPLADSLSSELSRTGGPERMQLAVLGQSTKDP